MAVWSDIADWVGPSPNKYTGQEQTPLWVVLHIQEGTEQGTIAWQKNPASKVSSHFLAPKNGRLAQMLDTADASWSVVAGNLRALSIECEGRSGDKLTPNQLESCAQVLARAHFRYDIPLTAVYPPAPGLTGHGLGGAAWGGHYDCPGTPILAQRGQIIARAAEIAGAPAPTPITGGITMPTIPGSIASEDPDLTDLAQKFPAGATFDPNVALIWTDVRAAAADEHARQARDAVAGLRQLVAADDAAAAAHLQQIDATIAALSATVHGLGGAVTGVQTGSDPAALAAALVPLLVQQLPEHITVNLGVR